MTLVEQQRRQAQGRLAESQNQRDGTRAVVGVDRDPTRPAFARRPNANAVVGQAALG